MTAIMAASSVPLEGSKFTTYNYIIRAFRTLIYRSTICTTINDVNLEGFENYALECIAITEIVTALLLSILE